MRQLTEIKVPAPIGPPLSEASEGLNLESGEDIDSDTDQFTDDDDDFDFTG